MQLPDQNQCTHVETSAQTKKSTEVDRDDRRTREGFALCTYMYA